MTNQKHNPSPKAKSTPGPWYLCEGSKGVICWRDYPICYMELPPSFLQGSVEANARLIVAAPELLAAAKKIIKEYANGALTESGFVDLEDAIAKAEGGAE